MKVLVPSALLAVLLLAWYFISGVGHEPSPPAQDVEEADSPPGSDARSDELVLGGVEQPQREEVVAYTRVLNNEGEPVAGALGSLTPLLPELIASPWRLTDPEQIERASYWGLSDERGKLGFSGSPERSDHVLWVTCLGYESVALRIEDPDKLPEALVLHKRAGMPVRVVDTLGSPVPGAVIRQLGLGNRAREEDWYELASHLFFRSYDTGVGVTEICATADRQGLWATSMGTESTPWVGTSSEHEVTLVVHQSFQLSGRVVVEGGYSFPPDARVEIFTSKGGVNRALTQVRVGESGSFGPVPVPIVPGNEIGAAIMGAQLSAPTHWIDDPIAAENRVVTITAKQAELVSVLAQTQDGTPLSGMSVLAGWTFGNDYGGETATTDDNGIARLSRCPPGTIQLSADGPGYWTPTKRTVDLTLPREGPLVLTLIEGGKLLGQCLHDGEPVEDFTVVAWFGHSGEVRTEETVRSSPDGRFELEGVPLGQVLVYASSTDHPQSEVQVVEVRPDQPGEVTIELPDPIRGRGRVVDNATLEPVPSATIQLYTNYQANYHSAWGALHSVDNDGTFEIVGFSPGDSRYVIKAPGYSIFLGQAEGVPGEVLDVGVIGLARNQPLDIVLRSESEVDYSKFEVHTIGNKYYPVGRFSNEGICRYEDAGPGGYFVTLRGPGGFEKTIQTYLYSGQPWVIEFPLGASRSLELDVVEADGSRKPLQWLRTTCTTEQGLPVNSWHDLGQDARVTINEIVGDEIALQVYDEQGALVGMDLVDLQQAQGSHTMVIENRGFLLEVVDSTRVPIPGVTVRLLAPHIGVGWELQVVTGQDGRYLFPSLGLDRVLVNLKHPTHGFRSDVEVDLTRVSADSPFIVELDSPARLRVQLVDGTTPIAGVPVRVYAAQCEFEFGNFFSDEQGLVESGELAEGVYRAIVVNPGLWSVEKPIEATLDNTYVPIQVRRVGDLAFEATMPDGDPASGVSIDVVSKEFGTSVASWISAGAALSRTGD